MNKDWTPQSEEGRELRKEKDQSRSDIDLVFLRFRCLLARRLIERIMIDGLLTNVYDWYADLERVLDILDDVAWKMTEVNNGSARFETAVDLIEADLRQGHEAQAGLGEASGD